MYLFHVCFTETSFCFVCSILALRLAFAFLFGCSISKNPPTHYLSTLLQSSRRFLWEYVSLFQFLEHCVQLRYCDDFAVLMTLQYCFIHRSILWRLCRIDDSAVLMILPYCSVYNFSMETTLPYWGLCRIVLHHVFSAVRSFVNGSEASLALRDSLLSADHCPH